MNSDIIEKQKLEKELNLKQLQIKSILTITQAINNNVAAAGLFQMYRSFLNWEMGIQKMILFIKKENTWIPASSINVDNQFLKQDLSKALLHHQRLHPIGKDEDSKFKDFDIIIPVFHKDQPIAYSVIGECGDDDDIYSKIQFITTITNIIAVAIENKRLFKQQIEQERLQREIELASEVQKMLIPNSLPEGKGYKLASIYKPHYNVGGDYFDFIDRGEQKFVFCIADISGKGVAAALLMANLQANLQHLVPGSKNLKHLVRNLNTAIYKVTKSDKFLTFFVAEVDLNRKKLWYVNAGHYPQLICSKGVVTTLNTGCTIIGAFKELPEIEQGEIELEGESVILCFTDGLVDLINEKGEFLKENQLKEFLQKNYSYTAEEINQNLLLELESFTKNSSFPDDIAVLTCKLNVDV